VTLEGRDMTLEGSQEVLAGSRTVVPFVSACDLSSSFSSFSSFSSLDSPVTAPSQFHLRRPRDFLAGFLLSFHHRCCQNRTLLVRVVVRSHMLGSLMEARTFVEEVQTFAQSVWDISHLAPSSTDFVDGHTFWRSLVRSKPCPELALDRISQ